MVRFLFSLVAMCWMGSAVTEAARDVPTDADEIVFVTLETEVWDDLAQDADLSSCGSITERVRQDPWVILAVAQDELGFLAAAVKERLQPRVGFTTSRTLEDAMQRTNRRMADRVFKDQSLFDIDRAELVNAVFPELTESEIIATIVSLSDYTNRYYLADTGLDAALWLRDTWQAMAENRPDVSIELFEHADFPQPSVIATVMGTTRPEEVVVIGGHLDSIASRHMTVTSRAPGADDNASGVATLTEVYRALLTLDYHPARSLSFMAYAAEEVGLFGSSDIAAAYAQDDIQVVGMLNLDMTNYHGSDEDIIIIDDFTDTTQNAFLGALADAYLNASWVDASCGYACSDHGSWTREGFPASMLFEARIQEINPYIHSAQDLIEVSDGRAEHAMKFARLTAAYAVELADGQMGEAMPPHDRWLVHLTSPDGGFSTQVMALNLADEEARMTLHGFRADGQPLAPTSLTVPALGLVTRGLEEIWPEGGVSHSAIEGPETCHVTAAYRSATGVGASAHVSESRQSGTAFTVYCGEWNLVFDGLALVNPGTQPLSVTAVQRDASGDVLRDGVLFETVAPGEKVLLVFDTVFAPAEGSFVTVRTDHPAAAVFLRGTPPGVSPGYLYENVPILEP